MPRTREALERLPGVGRKTANVILNTAFGEPTIAVDTHIFRVANRTGIAPGRTVRAVEDRLLPAGARVPPRRASLADSSRPLCLQGTPARCWRCLVRGECAFRPKTPAPAERVRAGRRARRS